MLPRPVRQLPSRAPRRSTTASSGVIPPIEWPVFADDIDAILELKRERNAVILAHNYQTPEIFHCVADIVGDSLALAREAMRADADVIVLAGVHFMAETAKLLNPGQDRADPRHAAPAARSPRRSPPPMCGCCAQRYPGVPIVTYVNTSAAVKAESRHLLHLGQRARRSSKRSACREVIMLPDEYLAQNVAAETGSKIIAWAGHCEVHERFTAGEIRDAARRASRRHRAGASGMPARGRRRSGFRRLDRGDGRLCRQRSKPARVVLLTECSMSDNVAVAASRARLRAARAISART